MSFVAVALRMCELCYSAFYFPDREKYQFTTQLSHIFLWSGTCDLFLALWKFWKALILVEHCHKDLESLPFELIIGSNVIYQSYSEKQESWAGETVYYTQKRQLCLLFLPTFFSGTHSGSCLTLLWGSSANCTGRTSLTIFSEFTFCLISILNLFTMDSCECQIH